ncbi:unnamed protein product [Cuscuta campestris]|uniref:Uncharacterized protein n=1 Tax=Cuscuta campestris TaxID=132261 RepID=A0A484KMN0_9ASTE|nr:unnamed protein product [Cuscuta campestris]
MPTPNDRFLEGSPYRASQLEEKVREWEQKAREMSVVIMRQTDELAKLSKAVRVVGAKNPQLKEENTRMDKVSHLKEALEEKEQ